MIQKCIIIGGIFLLLLGCKVKNKSTSCDAAKLYLVVDLEGMDGCDLVLEDLLGIQHQAYNISEFDFELIPGDEIYAELKINEDLAGICMAGPIAEIICIEKRSL